MTIRISLFDGHKVREETFRKVYRGRSLARLVENFYSFQGDQIWGKMVQFKGKERIILHKFGNIPKEAIKNIQ